eukprot:scaffold35224_cov55-Attheya_sp.AAC.3
MGYRLLILAYVAVCLARYTDGFSFNPLPSRVHRPAFSKTRTLGKTDDSETASGGLDVPFFASFSASGDDLGMASQDPEFEEIESVKKETTWDRITGPKLFKVSHLSTSNALKIIAHYIFKKSNNLRCIHFIVFES